MSMYESAEKLNNTFKECLTSCNKKVEIINAIIWFGSVAKFRCRNNIAYENFVKSVFNGISEIKREKQDNLNFEVLKAEQLQEVQNE